MADCCLGGAYFLGKSQAGFAYRDGAYKKKRVSNTHPFLSYSDHGTLRIVVENWRIALL